MLLRKDILLNKIFIQRNLPLNIQSEDINFFKKNSFDEIPEVTLNHYKNVLISNNEYKGILLNGISIDNDSLPGHGHAKLFSNWFLMSTYFSRKIKLNNDFFLLIYNHWCSGYFHWLLDAIPRLYIMKKNLNEQVLLIPSEWKKDNFHLQSLEPFQIKEIYFPKEGRVLKVKNLVMPSRVTPSGISSPTIVQEIRKFYLTYYNERLNLNLGEKIYITRKNASKRKIINEDEVIKYLTKHGFKTVDFQDYDFVEKISIASKAKIIVSVHGAGLTNILFMQNNGYVLELIHKEMKVLAYYFLADSLNLKYMYQKCEPVNNLKSFFTSDIKVDLKELEKNISLILKNVN